MDRTGTAVRSLTRDLRPAGDVGRRARLELVFGERRGRTVLVHQYVEPPFRVGRCLDTSDGLLVILASSAPGVFGGDRLDQTISVKEGARVRLVSQSALQIHPALSRTPARVVGRYDIEPGGTLDCWWDPLIPFGQASFEQRIDISVAPGGRLSWSDACMGGRAARGERWAFERLACELHLRHAAQLAYLERYAIDPASTTPLSRWTADSADFFGTTFRIGHDDRLERVETLHRLLQGDPNLSAAAALLENDLLVVRLAARSGVSFHRARAAVAAAFGVAVQKR